MTADTSVPEPELAAIRVAAFRGPVTSVSVVLAAVRKIEGAHPGVRLQLLDASRVYGADHLRQAALLAGRARARGDAVADDPAVAALCYAAATRQIDRALTFLGLREGVETVALLALGAADDRPADDLARELGWVRDDALLAGDDAVLDAFGISQTERALLPRDRWGDLVLERVALLDASR